MRYPDHGDESSVTLRLRVYIQRIEVRTSFVRIVILGILMAIGVGCGPQNSTISAESIDKDTNFTTLGTREERSCSAASSVSNSEQVDYNGVLPGITTSRELRALLGEPNSSSTYPDGQEWIYDEALVRTENGIVEFIDQSDLNDRILLRQITESLGCPDVIYLIDPSEEKFGDYAWTWVIYLRHGVMLTFYEFPISLQTRVESTLYFPPMTKERYAEQYQLYDPNFAREVTWEYATGAAEP